MTLPFFSASLEVFDIALAVVAVLRAAPDAGFQGRPVFARDSRQNNPLQHTNKNCFQEARVIDAIQEKRVLAILFADTSTRYSVLPKKGSVTVRDSGYPVCILLTFVLVLVIPVESE